MISRTKEILSKLLILVILLKYIKNYLKGIFFFIRLARGFYKYRCISAMFFTILFTPYLAYRHMVKKNIKANKKIPEMQYTLS